MIDLFLNSWFLAWSAALPVSDTPSTSMAQPVTSAASTLRRDMELIVQIRRALARDEALAKANIRVQVLDGKATLSGPVSEEKLIARALVEAKGVRGVLAVENQIRVVLATPDLPSINGPLPEEPPVTTTTAMVPREPKIDGLLTTRPMVEPTAVITLGAPVMGASPNLGPTRVVSYSIPRQDVLTLTTAIEDVRKRDRAFRGIQVDVRNTTLVIRGGAKGETLMSFAQDLRGIDGVDRVLIDTNRKR